MLEKIFMLLSKTPLISSIFNLVYTPIEKHLNILKDTLSEKTYGSIESMLDKISTISVILLLIYIIYSILFFLYSFVFKKRIKIKILISISFAFLFLLLFYSIYAYINTL